ncbi:hypothetical protein ACFLR8_02895, partial [Bacteroidota bacterium]
MKTPYRFTNLTLILTVLLVFSVNNCWCADDPDRLLELYLETGSNEYVEKISEGFPGSPYEKFCEAWAYLGANNERSLELALALVEAHPDFAPAHFALGTIKANGFKDFED